METDNLSLDPKQSQREIWFEISSVFDCWKMLVHLSWT